jgi:DNA-binding Lrp family transcriptional regulator
MDITKRDLLILSCLRANARCRLAEVSRRTHIPISTLFEKLRSYHGTVLTKTTSLLDFSAIGFSTRAHLLIRCTKQRDAVKQTLLANHNVNSLYRVNNGHDYLAECIFRTMHDAETFAEHLRTTYDAVIRIQYVLADLKRETFLSDPSLVHVIQDKLFKAPAFQ